MTQETKSAEQRGPTTATKIKIAVAAILGIFVLILIFQNLDAVPTKVLWREFNVPHALLLFIMLAIGFAGGVLATGAAYRRRRKS